MNANLINANAATIMTRLYQLKAARTLLSSLTPSGASRQALMR